MPPAAWARLAEALRILKQVVFQVDYGMVSHGLAPLYVDGTATELSFWGFSNDILRRLARLNDLYDRQVNWDNPADKTWRISERDRNEFNALLPFIISELQVEIGHRWEIIVEAKPI